MIDSAPDIATNDARVDGPQGPLSHDGSLAPVAEEDDRTATLIPVRVTAEEMRAGGYALQRDPAPELVFGLVGAMGSDLELAANQILSELQKYDYVAETIRISDLLTRFPEYRDLKSPRQNVDTYYKEAIKAGNELRARFATRDALAQAVVLEIIDRRATMLAHSQPKRAYVVRSLKLPEEIECLRSVYGEQFFCVAVNADAHIRKRRLRGRINDSYGDPERQRGAIDAEELLLMDEHEDEFYGQNVRDAFVKADYFVRSDDAAELTRSVERLVALIFDSPYLSPTRAEIAMMHARTAALRSVDLSRQIGAAIVARDGRVVTTGCNEVPRGGGGQYWEDDPDDRRDFRLGYDSNDRKKREAVLEMLAKLNDKMREDVVDDGIEALYRDISKRLKGTRIDGLVEFGRIVHAEMAAINASCVDTISVRDADLYCTTFPCHMCTRLIINVGIRNVYYIEPYPKSASGELYDDSIRINPTLTPEEHRDRQVGEHAHDRHVYFIPFAGVAPRRFMQLFARGRRKDEAGNVQRFTPGKAVPRCSPHAQTHYELEKRIEGGMGVIVRRLYAEEPLGTQLTLLADGEAPEKGVPGT
jgi:deoxycytidylate deaminase